MKSGARSLRMSALPGNGSSATLRTSLASREKTSEVCNWSSVRGSGFERSGISMSQAERLRWDERYRTGAYTDRKHPTALLAEWVSQLAQGRALDVACGAGRNSLYLAANGWGVDA